MSASDSAPPGRIGVLLLNFGEPTRLTLDEVQRYLERIFLQNVDLEAYEAEAALDRARQLASRRAPTLLEEYREIGGSPLNDQADAQARELEAELSGRGWSARTYSAFQFTAPFIDDTVAAARADGAERLIALPVYPLCGQSTTMAALERTREALDAAGWAPEFASVSGWHHHPDYVALRVENIRRFVADLGLDLTDPDTLLYFSAHGTPIKYLDEGNRYDRYVEEHTREIARRLGVGDRYAVGFQNHTNRKIGWTRPDNDVRVRELAERRLVVEPISFIHEQSETLAELDRDVRELVEGLGKEFHRVPVAHDDPAFIRVLADLVTRLACGEAGANGVLARCRCGEDPGVWCTNGGRELPPSPYIPAERR